jgi:hypothetical protein
MSNFSMAMPLCYREAAICPEHSERNRRRELFVRRLLAPKFVGAAILAAKSSPRFISNEKIKISLFNQCVGNSGVPTLVEHREE